MKTLRAMLSSAGLITALVALGTGPAVAETSGYLPTVKVIPLSKHSTTWVGQPIHYPVTTTPEVQFLEVDLPPGAQTGWHYHPVPSYEYILAGHLTVQTQTQRIDLHAGQTFVESVNVLHNGSNLGSEPVRILVIYTGVKDQPIAVKSGPPPGAMCCKPVQVH